MSTKPAIDSISDTHDLYHQNDYDPACDRCQNEFDWFADCERIVNEEPSIFAPCRTHIVVLMERIERLEDEAARARA